MGSAKYIVGGLLAGLGDGMVKNGAAKREAMLAELERNHDVMMEELRTKNDIVKLDKGHGYDMEERKFDADRDDKRSADDRAFDASEAEKDRGFKASESEKDRRNGLLDTDLVEIADPNSPSGTIWVRKSDAVGKPGKSGASDAEEIRAQKDADALDAEDRATEIVEGMAGMWSSDTSDFGAGGRAAAVEKVKKAILAGKSTVVINGKTVDLGGVEGEGSADVDASPKPDAAQPEQKISAGKPKGAGTEASPYEAVTQADIDWFKQNAPTGAVLSANGKLYTK